jgi:SAM-dependent methyltransferase
MNVPLLTGRPEIGAVADRFKGPAQMKANGKFYFRKVDPQLDVTDSFDRIKRLFKRFPRLYYFLIDVVSPVVCDRKPLLRFRASASGIILNIGSGNQPCEPRTINVDMIDYKNVDVVCDIHDLPFQDNSIDAAMSIAVLEHVKDPAKVLAEVYRVLKPGGLIFTVVPFMQPFHASPHDYQRYTLPGIEHLHREFKIVESGVFSGPVSGALWTLQECLASVLSLGIPFIRNSLTIIIMLATWPLKLFDVVCIKLPTAKNVASNFYFYGKKPHSDLQKG